MTGCKIVFRLENFTIHMYPSRKFYNIDHGCAISFRVNYSFLKKSSKASSCCNVRKCMELFLQKFSFSLTELKASYLDFVLAVEQILFEKIPEL